MASEKKKRSKAAYKRGYVTGFREAEKHVRDNGSKNIRGYSRGVKDNRKIRKIEKKVKKYESDLRGI